jgi:hypothetical protein
MGVVGLARTIAIEARYGIMSNVIAPLAQTPVTDGLFGGAMEAFDSEFVVPMVTYLVSDRCTLTSEIYSVGGGRVAGAVVGVTLGWIPGGETPSAEELVEHLDEIRGEEDLVFPSSAVEEIELTGSLV